MSLNWTIGDTYTFTTINPSILGDKFKDMTLVSIANFNIVNLLGFDAATKHKQVYDIDEYTSNYQTPDSYDYLIFETKNGDRVIFGKPWIIESSTDSLYGIDYTMEFIDVSIDDVDVITSQLNLMGYRDISVTLK